MVSHTSYESVIETRRDLHMHPERGWCEFRTSSLIANRLEELGFEVRVGPEAVDGTTDAERPDPTEVERCRERALAEGADPNLVARMADGVTGVVGILPGDGPTIGFRVDMDALPIEEADREHRPTGEEFRSKHEGVMHACGHDGHTAIGLGVAERIADHESLDGTLKLFFQPAEEGLGGGRAMAAGGLVDDVDALVAIHLGIGVPKGTIATGVEFLTAGRMAVRFAGKPAHAAAAPEAGANALQAAADAVGKIYAIPRHAEGRTRVNVGTLNAGTASNVIAESATMDVEARGATDELFEYTRRRVERAVEGAAIAHGVDYEVELQGKSISVEHEPEFAETVAGIVSKATGVERVESHRTVSGSEDACYLLKRVREHGGDATYAIVGAELAGPHHAATFDFDESALVTGVDALSRVAVGLAKD